MEKKIEIVVGACIVDDNNKVFLVKNKSWKQFVFCGGHVEFGESFEEALKREMREELGVEIDVFGQINTMQDISAEKHMVFVHYLVTPKTMNFNFSNEIKEYVWVDIIEAIASENVHENIRKTLLKIL